MNRIPIAENGYPVKTVQSVDCKKYTIFCESEIPRAFSIKFWCFHQKWDSSTRKIIKIFCFQCLKNDFFTALCLRENNYKTFSPHFSRIIGFRPRKKHQNFPNLLMTNIKFVEQNTHIKMDFPMRICILKFHVFHFTAKDTIFFFTWCITKNTFHDLNGIPGQNPLFCFFV